MYYGARLRKLARVEVIEKLPRKAIGKVLKRELRDGVATGG